MLVTSDFQETLAGNISRIIRRRPKEQRAERQTYREAKTDPRKRFRENPFSKGCLILLFLLFPKCPETVEESPGAENVKERLDEICCFLLS